MPSAADVNAEKTLTAGFPGAMQLHHEDSAPAAAGRWNDCVPCHPRWRTKAISGPFLRQNRKRWWFRGIGAILAEADKHALKW